VSASVAQVLAYDSCRAEGVHKSHGDPAPKRRVRAGPRIAYTYDPCRHRNAVHDETPVTVGGAAMGSTSVSGSPSSQCAYNGHAATRASPVLEIAELLQRLITRGDE
jgi:hypothetical protein